MRTLALTERPHTNPPDYTGAHRNTHVSTRPVVQFPAINTRERRAGHVKQAHRKRCFCFTFPYSRGTAQWGWGIKNLCAQRRFSGGKRPKMRLTGIRHAQTDRHSVLCIVMQRPENVSDAFFRFTLGKTSFFAFFASESD